MLFRISISFFVDVVSVGSGDGADLVLADQTNERYDFVDGSSNAVALEVGGPGRCVTASMPSFEGFI